MIEDDRHAHLVARFVDEKADVITNALHVHADRMNAASEDARVAHEAGQNDPEVKAAQNKSLITNEGYRQSAALFEQEAIKSRAVARTLADLLAGDSEDD